MSRLTQAVVALLFGGAILKVSLTDIYLRYVKHGLRPCLIAAGLLLVVAAVMTIWYELRRPDEEHSEAGPSEHGHAHHEPGVGWLMLLPVLGLLLVTPPALGSFTAGQAGSVVATASDSDYPPLPPGDPAPISLLDYASRALFDGDKSIAGRNLKLTGFVDPGPDGKPMLVRIVLTCCAADGRPIKVGLTGDVVVDAAPNTWVDVIGVYSSTVGQDPVNKAPVAYVKVTSWQPISEPKQPYA